ncbi:MAG TPA: hypothetical protein VI114_07360, partial [Chthoniobacterales bacterium]
MKNHLYRNIDQCCWEKQYGGLLASSLEEDRSALRRRTAELVEFAGRSGDQSDGFSGIRRF